MEVGLEVALDDAIGLDIRDVAEERQAQIGFDVILALDGVVQVVDKEGQTDGNAQASDQAEEDRKRDARLDKFGRDIRSVPNDDVVNLAPASDVVLLHPGEDGFVKEIGRFGFALKDAV